MEKELHDLIKAIGFIESYKTSYNFYYKKDEICFFKRHHEYILDEEVHSFDFTFRSHNIDDTIKYLNKHYHHLIRKNKIQSILKQNG